MHFNAVISELNRIVYKLHSKIIKKPYFNQNLNGILRDHTNLQEIYFSNPTDKEL